MRGRRFMRPALTVVTGARRIRLLADLEHKPWAAEDGEPWIVEFPCELDRRDVEEAELTVAPDITVVLPLAEAVGGAAKRGRPTRAVAETPARAPVTVNRVAVNPEPSQHGAAEAPAEKLRRVVTELQEERRRLTDEVERLTSERGALETRAEKLSMQLEQLAGEREELLSAGAETSTRFQDTRVAHDRMAAELEAVRRERADALESAAAAREASDRFLSERAAALAAQTRAESERDEAAAARDQALAERDAAVAVRHHALAERDAARAARDKALAEHSGLVRTNERLQTELADQISARRGAALVIRRAAQEPPASRPFALLVPRAIALLVLVLIALVILAVLRVI